MRLAEVCGSLNNVDGMLHLMTPEQMDEVQAYDNIHGVGLTRLVEIVASGLTSSIHGLMDKPPCIEKIRKSIDPWFRD